MRHVTMSLGLAAALCTGASAQVESYTGSQIVNQEGFANFNTLKYPDPLLNYTEGGLIVSIDHEEFDQMQIDGTPAFYPNAGDTEMVVIKRADGADFEALEFQVWNGWVEDPSNIWAQAYLAGVLQQDFDLEHPGPSQGFPVLGFKGRFDELRIAAYFDTATRDLHDPSAYEAVALDNMSFGTLGGNECYPDFTGDGVLDLFDFLAFVNAFNAGDEKANCDGEGGLDLFDFLCFTNAFNQGC